MLKANRRGGFTMKREVVKKGLVFLLVLLTVCFFAGCGNKPAEEEQKPAEDPKEEQAEEEVFDEKAFLEEIDPVIDFLISAEEEVFGAEYDSETVYSAAFDTDGRQGEPAVLYPAGGTVPDGYFRDNAEASYYPVTNYKNFAELEAAVHKYLAGEGLEGIPEYKLDFAEVDGALYLVRGGRGYGELLPVKDTLVYEGEKEGARIVTIDYELFDEYDHTAHITLNETDEGWKITDIHREWPKSEGK